MKKESNRWLEMAEYDLHTAEAMFRARRYTLEEYKNASHLTFLGEIKRTGRLIYEAD